VRCFQALVRVFEDDALVCFHLHTPRRLKEHIGSGLPRKTSSAAMMQSNSGSKFVTLRVASTFCLCPFDATAIGTLPYQSRAISATTLISLIECSPV
jgi:hypothetical protein